MSFSLDTAAHRIIDAVTVVSRQQKEHQYTKIYPSVTVFESAGRKAFKESSVTHLALYFLAISSRLESAAAADAAETAGVALTSLITLLFTFRSEKCVAAALISTS